MTFDPENLLESMLESLGRIDSIKVEDIPNIDLYMDQVTTFMEKNLAPSKRYPEDKILTKTMINNYAKNHLLPPPEKKKYSRRHVLMLIFIYYFKNILSISDIRKLMNPLTMTYFYKEDGLSLEDIYENVFRFSLAQIEEIQDYVKEKFTESGEIRARSASEGGSGEDQDFLQFFSFICALSFDAYVKQMMIEKLIDLIPDPDPGSRKK